MQWYEGMNVLEILDSFQKEELPEDKPFRMPVQDVYKFTKNSDKRRIISGTIESGKLTVGDEVIFYPSGKRTNVKTIEAFNSEMPRTLNAGWACGFTVTEQIYVKRGEIACLANELKPKVTGRVLVNLFWLGKKPFVKDKRYLLKIGTARVGVQLEEIISVLDASNLDRSKKDCIERHEIPQQRTRK
jgi:bifunctional enzyme CysN/CysC